MTYEIRLLWGLLAFVALWTVGSLIAIWQAMRSTEGMPPTFPGSPPTPPPPPR